MDQTERQVIDGLFERLGQAERASGQRDAEAERHISGLLGRQPAAPYYMAQAILVQEHALKQAQERIQNLEAELEERPAAGAGGGFLGGLFGGGAPQPQKQRSVPRSGAGARYPGQRNGAHQAEDSPVARYQQSGQGGGFLAGAMQTAVGVAGGVILGNMLMNMFTGGGTAEAAQPEAAAETQPAEAQNASNENNDAGADQGPGEGWQEAGDDSGFDFGDFGGDMDI